MQNSREEELLALMDASVKEFNATDHWDLAKKRQILDERRKLITDPLWNEAGWGKK